MDIVLQAVIDALESKLKGLDPDSQEAKDVQAQLQQFYAAGTGADTAKKAKESDAKINADIKKKKQQINVAKAKGQDTTGLESDVNNLKNKLSTAAKDSGKKKVVTGSTTLPPGATVSGTDILVGGDKVGTVSKGTDGKPVYNITKKIPVGTKTADGTTTTGTGTTNGKLTLNPIKTAYIGYLKQTFATLEDKTQKAEIDNLLTTAKTQNWTAAEFQSHLEGTTWWQQTAPTLRQWFLDSHDPRKASEYTQSLNNKVDSIKSKLESLGVQITATDPITGKYIDNTEKINGLALEAVQKGWTDAQLSEAIATKSNILFTGGGLVGSNLDQIKRQANLYGVTLDQTQMDNIQRGLLNPNDGRDVNYYLNDIKNQSYNNPMYKAFSDIMQKNNTDLYSVTSSYRQQMANLLEVDPSAVTWKDLTSKIIDPTTGMARTYSDFTKQVKQDPLWQTTRNAKETYTNMGEDLMKMFGFIG